LQKNFPQVKNCLPHTKPFKYQYRPHYPDTAFDYNLQQKRKNNLTEMQKTSTILQNFIFSTENYS